MYQPGRYTAPPVARRDRDIRDVSVAERHEHTRVPDDITGFDADRMYICQEKVITVSLGTVDDKDDIDAVVKAFTEGEPVSLVQEGESYKLKFASDKYPGLYYNLMYIEGGDGNNYIYDRTTKTCVDVGDVLLDYLPR